MNDMKEILRTSNEWQKLKSDHIVLDPDGWDRENYQYSWFEEEIAEEEYNQRLMHSTAIYGVNFIDKNGNTSFHKLGGDSIGI